MPLAAKLFRLTAGCGQNITFDLVDSLPYRRKFSAEPSQRIFLLLSVIRHGPVTYVAKVEASPFQDIYIQTP